MLYIYLICVVIFFIFLYSNIDAIIFIDNKTPDSHIMFIAMIIISVLWPITMPIMIFNKER